MLRAGRILMVLLILVATAALQAPISAAGGDTTGTPEQLVATYRSLADTILAAKKTEWNMVSSILATTYRHAEVTLGQARAQIQAKKDAKADVEKLAALISQLGNEGDAAVGAVRKKLVEGGHHHHASEEQQGIYDEGFVIVTKAAKKVFLDAAGQIGKSAQAPSLTTLDAEWLKVQQQYAALMK
jgi:riboflavin biosynthesis pyrimidine reductase